MLPKYFPCLTNPMRVPTSSRTIGGRKSENKRAMCGALSAGALAHAHLCLCMQICTMVVDLVRAAQLHVYEYDNDK